MLLPLARATPRKVHDKDNAAVQSQIWRYRSDFAHREAGLPHTQTKVLLLQEYVRARLIQFAGPFARRINPTLSQQIVQQAAAETIASLPAAEVGRVAIESRDLQLVFRHDCL